MKCYAEREPEIYYATLKQMHAQMRQAFARGLHDKATDIMREIALYRLQAHTTVGLQLQSVSDIPKAFCLDKGRYCTPENCGCSPMPDGFSAYRARNAVR